MIRMLTHTHAHMHAHIHTHACTHTHASTHTHTYTYYVCVSSKIGQFNMGIKNIFVPVGIYTLGLDCTGADVLAMWCMRESCCVSVGPTSLTSSGRKVLEIILLYQAWGQNIICHCQSRLT